MSHYKQQVESPTKRRLQGYGQEKAPVGVPITGVISHPFKAFEAVYYDDFANIRCHTATHPFLNISSFKGSLTFDVISNSAAPPPTTWETEFSRQFKAKNPDKGPGAGVRTEQR